MIGRRALGLLVAGCLLAGGLRTVAAAEPRPADYVRLNAALVANHVIPRYTAFAEAAVVMRDASVVFHGAPSKVSLDAAQGAFRTMMAAWQGCQHLRFGPIETLMRGQRLAFWPDPRNSIGRALDALLTARDLKAISQEAFGFSSIATQGIPALERLLFDPAGNTDLLAADDDGRFRRTMVHAVAQNIATMAAGIRDDWRGGSPSHVAVTTGVGKSGARYQKPREVTLDLFKSLHTAVELVADHKVARPLGASLAEARPQTAESWRSQQSLTNIRANLAAAEGLYLGEGGMGISDFVRSVSGDKALDDLMRRAFAQTRATAEGIPLPLEDAIADAGARKQVEKLVLQAKALKQLLAERVTVGLGIPLGFNALDGD